jgi:hypothetical protein
LTGNNLSSVMRKHWPCVAICLSSLQTLSIKI